MKGIDTNVLVRFLVRDDEQQALFSTRVIVSDRYPQAMIKLIF